MVKSYGISFIVAPGLTLNGDSELKHLMVSWCMILGLVGPSVAKLEVILALTGHHSLFFHS